MLCCSGRKLAECFYLLIICDSPVTLPSASRLGCFKGMWVKKKTTTLFNWKVRLSCNPKPGKVGGREAMAWSVTAGKGGESNRSDSPAF